MKKNEDIEREIRDMLESMSEEEREEFASVATKLNDLRDEIGDEEFADALNLMLSQTIIHYHFIRNYETMIRTMSRDDLIEMQISLGDDDADLRKKDELIAHALKNNTPEAMLESLSWANDTAIEFLQEVNLQSHETTQEDAQALLSLYHLGLINYNDEGEVVIPRDLVTLVRKNWDDSRDLERQKRNYLLYLTTYCGHLFGYISADDLYARYIRKYPDVSREEFDELTSAMGKRFKKWRLQKDDFSVMNLTDDLKKRIDELKTIPERSYPTEEEVDVLRNYGCPSDDAYDQLIGYLMMGIGMDSFVAMMVVEDIFFKVILGMNAQEFVNTMAGLNDGDQDEDEESSLNELMDYYVEIYNCTRQLSLNGRSPDMMSKA